MKLCLKAGEHLRLAHDHAGAALQVYVQGGIVHITALAPNEQGDVTIIVEDDNPSVSLMPGDQLAAREAEHGVAALAGLREPRKAAA